MRKISSDNLMRLMALLGTALVASSPVHAASVQSRDMVRLTYIPGSAAIPVIVAVERGFFRKHGLTVSALPVLSQQAVTTALALGITDFATGSQSWLLDMANSKIAAKVVALSGYGRQMELIVPSWDKKTKKISDMKGKRILIVRGTHNFDAVPEFFRVLLFSRMRLNDVRISFINLQQLKIVMNPKFRRGYRKQNIAGIFTLREYTHNFTKDKRARVVMSNAALTKLIGRIGARPLFASDNIVSKSPETVKRFVRAWVEASAYIANNPKDVSRLMRIYFARQYGVRLPDGQSELLLSLIKYDRVAWTEYDIKGAIINGKAISAARNLLFSHIKDAKKRPFQKPPQLEKYFDMSFVKSVVAEQKRSAATGKEGQRTTGVQRTSIKPDNTKTGSPKKTGADKTKN